MKGKNLCDVFFSVSFVVVTVPFFGCLPLLPTCSIFKHFETLAEYQDNAAGGIELEPLGNVYTIIFDCVS